ncbi:coagulation factor XI-like [Pelmatolapia mariae]|uniref:coagulation factor XI-like n=1 Tax=Pelmatolapia mariae TaxID=158779 RepID=UPI003211D8E9
MITHLIFVGLLSLHSSSLSQACNPNILENMDFPGNDITFLYSPDVNHCQLLCTQHPSCLFFSFVRADWTHDDRRDYRSLFTGDHEECQRVCTQDPACQFFAFVKDNFSNSKVRYKCHLKFSWTVPRTPVIERRAGVTSGFSHITYQTQHFDKVCQRKLFPNTDIPGSDIESLPAACPEHCQTLCSTHPRCTYFTYNRNTFVCYLKENTHEIVTRADTGTSGLPHRSCQLNSNWARVAHEGVDFKGSDIRYELIDDADTCQKTCTEDPHCQFYTYVDETFFDCSYWRRCYLKRVITIPAPPKVIKVTNVVSGFSLKNCP